MSRMPETSINLPIPTSSESSVAESRGALTPGNEPANRVWSMLAAEVKAYVDAQGGGQGLFDTPMDSVKIVRSFQEMMPHRMVYRPSLCIVIQGAKQILFGEDRVDYGAMQCLIVSMELPASGRIAKASATEPYIGITIDFDIAMMREVIERMDTKPPTDATPGPCVFVTDVDDTLGECILRLIRMTQRPDAIPILYPSVMREIYYWLLSGMHGSEMRKLVLPGTHIDRVAKAIQALRLNFAQTLRVERLADLASMSPSSFHQHFKALTSMTPLQFQKQLRLLEARRLMATEAVNVADAAYQVGYESTSQFSREYSRMFGVPPKRSMMNLKATPA